MKYQFKDDYSSMQSKPDGLNYLLLVNGFFFLVFCLVSFVNHYYYRSAGLDYGIANQALFQYAHFGSATCTLLLGAIPAPYLSLHLSLWVPILSPFYWIFGSYTLLFFQNVAIIFAGFGIIKLAKLNGFKVLAQVLFLVQFYASFAIYSALAFDYHDNVIGACFVPWIFYFYQKKNKLFTLLCFFAVLISKENMAIWLGFGVLTLIWVNRKKGSWKDLFPWFLLGLSIAWFLIASIFIMPALNPNGKFEQLNRYSHLGSNLSEIVFHIFTHPYQMLRMFFESHIQPDDYDVVKEEFLWALLFSGGIALVLEPAFLWFALPILMQKLWNKELAFWGISLHYQIELAPVISLAIIYLLRKIQFPFIQHFLLFILAIGTLVATIIFMFDRQADYNSVKENVFDKRHYQSEMNVRKLDKRLNAIPMSSAVCAQSNLMPHLAFREKLYHFPYIEDATYLVVLQPGLNAYPISEQDAIHLLDSIRHSGKWMEDSSAYPLRVFLKIRGN